MGNGCGERGFDWAGLEGGGVIRPADWLESGELAGVSVREEISRQARAVRSPPHQNRADGLCIMKASLLGFRWRS